MSTVFPKNTRLHGRHGTSKKTLSPTLAYPNSASLTLWFVNASEFDVAFYKAVETRSEDARLAEFGDRSSRRALESMKMQAPQLGTFYGKSSFDPWLIVGQVCIGSHVIRVYFVVLNFSLLQILTLQSLFYLSLAAFLGVAAGKISYSPSARVSYLVECHPKV